MNNVSLDTHTIVEVGIAADHAGFQLKEYLKENLAKEGYRVTDFGDEKFNADDDYPDYVIRLGKAMLSGPIIRGIAICGSGVGACITANKIPGIRACLINDKFSAQQGVQDDNMNILCLGARVVDYTLALDLSKIFLKAKYKDIERHNRRLAKVKELENIQKMK